jgi:nifR3 family TIM-barrel protein
MLLIGTVAVDPPVILAPMAGVTNRAFRRLCRRHGGALLVSEMVNARALVEGSRRSAEMTAFDHDETTRSIQLYGTDPEVIADAVRIVIDRGAEHVDLNFGCPVRKVTRHGGGAAVPARPRLLGAIVAGAVRAAGSVPVTIKMRIGLDDARPTHLQAGRIAASEGAAAVALHARTASQMYSGAARWSAIADLVATLDRSGVPVLGNGDVWSPADAQRMLADTGCAGVVVGRACLGRPWFFAELAAGFAGTPMPPAPRLGEVVDTIIEHARLLEEHGASDRGERDATLGIRKHIGWYLTGYPVGGATRRALTTCESLAELEQRLRDLDRDIELLPGDRDRPRGTHRGPVPVTIPTGWMDADATAPPESRLAELAVSGG